MRGRRARWRLVALSAAATLVGCFKPGGLGESTDFLDSSPSVDSRADSAIGDVSVDAPTAEDGSEFDAVETEESAIDGDADAADTKIDDADSGCPVFTTTDACKGIPRLLEPQVLDGNDDDFACIPTTTFTIASAKMTVPSPAPAGATEVVHMRAAWTPTAFALYVRVEDSAVVVAPMSDPAVYDGDAVEIYASGFGTLTGFYDGTADKGALQIVAAPGDGSTAPRARIYQNGDKGPLTSYWISRHVAAPSGYAIEFAIPWSVLNGPATPSAGAKVGLDLAIDVNDDPTMPTARSVWALWQSKSVTGPPSASCGGPPALPYCDDRTWCVPALE